MIDWDLAQKFALPVVGGLATKILSDLYERRPNLIAGYVHSGAVGVKLDESEIRFHVHALLIKNQGRQSARDVRIGHNVLPHFEIFPAIDYTIKELPGGSKEIQIPVLTPKKTITINYLYHPPIFVNDIHTHIECESGAARIVPVLPTRQMPRWVQYGLYALIGYGGLAIAYTVYEIVSST